MRWCFLVAVTIGLSVTDAVSFAQQIRAPGQGEAERLAAGRRGSGSDAEYLQQRDAGYFAKSGVVRFRLIQGRLQLDAPRHRKGSQNCDQDGVYESITVSAQRGIPSVHYVCQTKVQHLTLSVANATDLRIESYLPQTGERAVLDQPDRGPIAWAVKRGDLEDKYQGATLLHINKADPVGFDRHCGWIVTRLMQGRSLRSIEVATKQAMFNQIHADDGLAVHREQVLDCVERLGAKRRSVRVAASKQLLNWGTPILPIVNCIDLERLNCEQRDRLESTISRLKRAENDSPASLAMLLVNDQQHWQSIAHQLSDDQLRVANSHLDRIGLAALSAPQGAIEQIASDATTRR